VCIIETLRGRKDRNTLEEFWSSSRPWREMIISGFSGSTELKIQ